MTLSDEVLFTILKQVWIGDELQEWSIGDLACILLRQPLLRNEFNHSSPEARFQKALKIILNNRNEVPKYGWIIDEIPLRLHRTCLAEIHRDYEHCEECYNRVECLMLPLPIWNLKDKEIGHD